MLRIDDATEPRRRAGHRLQRAVRLPRPVRQGAQLALAEAYRNVAVSGAQPVAITDCLNFGSPEDPAAMWQFTEAIAGLVEGCRELGTPVTGGNVSFYNQTGDTAILPTPGGRRARRDRRRHRPDPDRLRAATATRSGCWGRPATSWPARPGPTSCTVTWVGCRRRSTWRTRSGWPGCWCGRPARTAQQRPRPGRRRPGPGPGRECAAAGDRGDGGAGRGRPVRRAVLREHRSGAGLAAGVPLGGAAGAGRAGGERRRVRRLGVTGGDALAVEGQFTLSLDEIRTTWQAPIPAAMAAAGPADRHPVPPVSGPPLPRSDISTAESAWLTGRPA